MENVYKDAAQFQFREPARAQDDATVAMGDSGDGGPDRSVMSPAEDERETGKCIIQFSMTMQPNTLGSFPLTYRQIVATLTIWFNS